MPLIVLSGIPASGKTTRANELYRYFAAKHIAVRLINEESLLIVRDEGYKGTRSIARSMAIRCIGLSMLVSLVSDARVEKMTRATLKAAIERALNKDTVVIADSMNYIKGFRYELFCIAKAQTTPHCIVCPDDPWYCNTRCCCSGCSGCCCC
jgi:protein KTI12